MFILSMAMIVGGYVLLYYGYSMFSVYKANYAKSAFTNTTQGGAPMSLLLGLTGLADNTPGSQPPFALGGNSGATPASNPTGTSGTSGTGGGVQSV
jgi:hypothetical protein